MAEPLWTAAEIAAATQGAVLGGGFAAQGVSIDSRSVEPGDLFVALAGVRDGHEFVEQALAKGAAGVLVSQDVAGPAVKVADTFQALEALGVASRERAPQVKRGAVTGSVGKTSVTQAVRAGLMLAGRAHSSVKSYNNHIGVPLTLARMPRDTERAVFEIGMNHADEIRPLSKFVRPHAVAITTVGPVHVENFPDGETGVARAKAEIFEGLEPGGIAVLNADNPWFDLLAGEARKVGAQVRTFGKGEDCDARLIDFQVAGGHAVVQARLHGKALDFPILQTGFHWGPNSMAVLLMLEALDVDLSDGLAALGSFEPLAGRGAERQVRLAGGAFTLIDESYNANPAAMGAAFEVLAAARPQDGQGRVRRGRRIAFLGDMLELGPRELELHAGLAGAPALAEVAQVHCAGARMRALHEALPPARRGEWFPDAVAMAARAGRLIDAGDIALVKGSNGSRVSLVVEAIKRLGEARPTETLAEALES